MVPQPQHGAKCILNLFDTKVELIALLGEASPKEKFLERNPGMWHSPRVTRSRFVCSAAPTG